MHKDNIKLVFICSRLIFFSSVEQIINNTDNSNSFTESNWMNQEVPESERNKKEQQELQWFQ